MIQVWANKIGGELPRIVRTNPDGSGEAWLYHHGANPHREPGGYQWTPIDMDRFAGDTHVPYFTGTFDECQNYIESTKAAQQ